MCHFFFIHPSVDGHLGCFHVLAIVNRAAMKTIIQKDTCTPMFIAALFTITRTWKQPKCPLTDGWIKKRWHIYIMEYYSAIKKNNIMPFAATWMQLEIIILSEKDKYDMLSLICGI